MTAQQAASLRHAIATTQAISDDCGYQVLTVIIAAGALLTAITVGAAFRRWQRIER